MALTIAYSSQAGVAYNITFKEFDGREIARSYQSTASFDRSLTGTQILSGPPTRAKYIWTVSAYITKEKALIVDELFRAWDLDRSTGLAAAVGVLDQNFGPDINGSAVISTPPTFSYYSESFVSVTLGLIEV